MEEEYFIEMLKKEYNKSFNYQNLEIEFKLYSPICMTTPFMYLDSLIDYLILIDVFGRDFYVQDKKMNVFENFDFTRPYDRFDYRGKKIAKSSVIQFNKDIHPKINTIYKRFEERFCEFSGKIRQGMGHFKSFCLKHVYIPVDTVRFYVKGDYNEIKRLFDKNLYALGKYKNIGYGFIREYNIRIIEKDYSIVKNDIAMRTIPIDICKYYEDSAILPIINPYWKENNLHECVIPGKKVKL